MTQPSFLSQTYILHLNPLEASRLREMAVSAGNASGGWQSLIRLLAGRLTTSGHLDIESQELDRVAHHIEAYGFGGYQNVLKTIRRAAWAAGWK